MGKGIHIEGLSKRYGTGDTAVDALRDVNMSVLHTLDARDSSLLLGFAGCLGWTGAMISLRQHLQPL